MAKRTYKKREVKTVQAENLVPESEVKAYEATVHNLELEKEELEIELAKQKAITPVETKVEAVAITTKGKQVRINSTEGTVDMQNNIGMVVARAVPLAEAQKRLKKYPNLSIIEKK